MKIKYILTIKNDKKQIFVPKQQKINKLNKINNYNNTHMNI